MSNLKTTICFLSLLNLAVYAQQYYQESKNFTTILPSQNVVRASSARQYGPPVVESIFKPGYQYPPSQKIQQLFSHDNKLHIYLFQNKLSLYCAADTTYEKITWKKYSCPQQIATQNGETIAVGPMVQNPNVYGINSFGRNEEFVSELLIKQPMTAQADGAYVCEGVFMSTKYPYEPVSVIRDIIIIGGLNMYHNCFSSRISIKRSAVNQTNEIN